MEQTFRSAKSIQDRILVEVATYRSANKDKWRDLNQQDLSHLEVKIQLFGKVYQNEYRWD